MWGNTNKQKLNLKKINERALKLFRTWRICRRFRFFYILCCKFIKKEERSFENRITYLDFYRIWKFALWPLVSSPYVRKSTALKYTVPSERKCLGGGARSRGSPVRYSVALLSLRGEDKHRQPAMADLTKRNTQLQWKWMSFGCCA